MELAAAISSGSGIGGAALNVGLDLIGVASPIPGAGEALKAIRGGAEMATKGEEGAKIASKFLESKGMKEAGKEVTVKTEKGSTRVDRVMKDGEKNVGLEAKNGPTAGLNKNQKVQHGEVNSGGSNTMTGGNAEKAGLEGQSVDHVVTVHVENDEVTKAYCQLPSCKN